MKRLLPVTYVACLWLWLSPPALSAVGDTCQCDTVESFGFRETIKDIDEAGPFTFRWRKGSVALGKDNSVTYPITESDPDSEKFYAEERTVEFFKNTLLVLSSSVINIKEVSQDYISKILEESKKEINKDEIKDKEKYILSYKINSLEEIKR